MIRFKNNQQLHNSIIFVILSASIFTSSHAASVGGESPPAARLEMHSLNKQLKQDYSIAAIPLQIVLDTVSASEKASLSMQRKDQPLKIGFGRDLPQLYQGDLYPWLSWINLREKSQVAVFSITSPDARAIRVGIQIEQLPQDAEIRFFSTKNLEIFGPFNTKYIRSQQDQENISEAKSKGAIFWSPVIEGETAGVEVYLPSPAQGGFISICKVKTPAFRRVDFISSPYW